MMDYSQASTTRPKLGDEAFEAYMRGRRSSPPVWTMSGLDGYLTALIIGRKFIDPRQRIPLLIGRDALNAPTEHQGRADIVQSSGDTRQFGLQRLRRHLSLWLGR
ncbi:hypothetical protein EV129_1189 [Rhizobium azibense]|uniref:Uncharacterized protein n=1 Tax=Rhizobium azibense TaxID=1136135 RepID=A0A4R3REK2_9HYPH|nr:hypothetical protein EV129_1189 [Rhizobium azibense]